jgi:hypothetical protein
LSIPVTKEGKYLYPIVVKQQRDGGIHHLVDVMNGKFGSVPQKRGIKGYTGKSKQKPLSFEEGREDKMIIQSRVGRYKKHANQILDNVCKGRFP